MGAIVPAVQGELTRVWQRRTRPKQFAVWFGWLVGVAIFSYCWHLISGKTIWMFVNDAPRQAADMAERMIPPKWSYMEVLWGPIWDTINIATLGTVIAIVIAVPVAFCAARNTTPSNLFVRPVALFVIVSSRSINSLIWALMLVTLIGPGVLAGVIAIGLRSIGFCAKLLYEAIEEIERALETALSMGSRGLKRERIAPSVRDELEELRQIGARLGELLKSRSEDADWFLSLSDPLSPPGGKASRFDGFDYGAQAAARLQSWGRRAMEAHDAESQPEIPSGPSFRRDLWTAGQMLAGM